MAKTDIVIVGVGGQGSLSASWFLGEAAAEAGIKALVGEVHGMAQRGGIVESTVRLGDVHGPIVSLGAADVLLGFEPVETLRFLNKASPKTLVITNTYTIVPAMVSIKGATYPKTEGVIDKIKSHCKNVIALDATTMAKEAGTPKAVNAVLLGVLAGAGGLPMDTKYLKDVVLSRVPQRAREVNDKAFEMGVEYGKKHSA